jgi:hypothetical protein
VRAYELLERAGSNLLAHDVIFGICITGVFGGISVQQFLQLLDDLDTRAAQAGPLLAATLESFRARVEFGAGTGTVDAVRSTADREAELLEQTGSLYAGAVRQYERVVVPWLEGDLRKVEEGWRERVEETRTVGTQLFHANALASWATALCDLGEWAKALEVVAEARACAHPEDIADQVGIDLAEAYARALSGEREEPLALIERARRTAQGTDMSTPVQEAEYIEACVRNALGDVVGARRILEERIAYREQRGFHRIADRYREELGALDPASRD